MREIVFFSNNQNKINEISNLFLKFNLKLLTLNDFENIISPEEIGKSFKDNAKIKSVYGLKKFNKYCFADDSGICIEALNGGPGVCSKQYLESKTNKNVVLNKIITKAKNLNNFKAFFETTICLSLNDKKQLFFTSRIHGRISDKILGEQGFGYDSIFIPRGNQFTFAEMNLEQKNLISHRSIAINKLMKYLSTLI